MDKKAVLCCIIPIAAAAVFILALPFAMSNLKGFSFLDYGLPALLVLCIAMHAIMMLRGHKH